MLCEIYRVKLDWNRIVCNAITVLVASVFVGASAHLWSGVQSIDSRIDSNLVEIKATQEVLAERMDSISNSVGELRPLVLGELIDPTKGDHKKTQELIDEKIQQQIQQQPPRR